MSSGTRKIKTDFFRRFSMGKGFDFAMSKTAGVWGAIQDGFSSNDLGRNMDATKLLGGYATSAVLGAYGMKKVIDGILNDRSRWGMLEDLMMNDGIISKAEPQRVKEFYATIHHLAPSISGDKNVVRELLQNFVKFDRVDINSVKALADTQKSFTSGQKGLGEKINLKTL
jgi:hypothetical protein